MKAVRVLRRIGGGLLVLVLVLVVAGTVGGVVAARASFPDYDRDVRLSGLSAPVDVYRDEHGVPQVYAADPEDLFRAQGYLHAQDRFWEMDFRRHVTAGRLAELFGPSQVETDAYVRTLGWRRVAEAEYEILDQDTRRWLEAYAEGVNAWLDGHSGVGASLEYGLLKLQNPDYRIEKWGPVDSISWLKAMAWDLRGNMRQELDRAALLGHGLTREQVEQLYPQYPDDRHEPIVTTGGVRRGVFDQAAATSEAVGSPSPPAPGGGDAGVIPIDAETAGVLRSVQRGLETIPQLLGPNGQGIGSNSWVIDGSRTSTGKPLLADDMHLGPSAPGIWYQMGLHCTRVTPECPFDVSGYTFSGLPGVIVGHNSRVAWGFTNLEPDTVDLYLEKITGDEYEMDGRKIRLDTRTEKIKVAGAKTVTITVRSTQHGPLLSDRDEELRDLGGQSPVSADGAASGAAEPADPAFGVALRWIALEPNRTADAIFAVNTASDWNSFREGARLFAVPAQNLVYADVDGNIGYQAPGEVPLRESGDGRWPVPGWLSEYEWRGRVPFESMPTAFNPPSGYVATANQQVVRPGYPYLLTTDWDYGYRSQRIADMITSAQGKIELADVERAQFDSRNGNAAALVPRLLAMDVPEDVRPARELLRDWDQTEPENSAAAAFFNATWRHLLARTFDELPEENQPDGGSRWFEVVRTLLDQRGSAWWDDQDTDEVENRDDMLRGAMEDAHEELTRRLGDRPADWRWGDLHTLELKNASFGRSGVGLVEWLFNRGPYAASGGDSVVNATGWTAPNGYTVDWVPSMRMVVDLDDLDRSRWVNLTGASGHAFHRHYTDQVELWRRGESTPMLWDRASIEREARYSMVLTP